MDDERLSGGGYGIWRARGGAFVAGCACGTSMAHLPTREAALAWLVAHAQAYHLSEVRYAGFSWKAANGSMGWQRESNPTSPSGKNGIVAG